MLESVAASHRECARQRALVQSLSTLYEAVQIIRQNALDEKTYLAYIHLDSLNLLAYSAVRFFIRIVLAEWNELCDGCKLVPVPSILQPLVTPSPAYPS